MSDTRERRRRRKLTARIDDLRADLGAGARWLTTSGWRDPRWREADEWRGTAAGGFQTPARVCPRGCVHEVARRELVTRTALWGQARVRVRFAFETETCPHCGSRMVERCGRCNETILAPVKDRCRFCGLPQSWSPERLATARRTRPRPWRRDARDPAIPICTLPGRGELLVIEGDVTTMAVDGVVSNDDVDGRMYSVIASTIKSVAGPDVERQSIAQGPFPRGEAWYTDAGSLPAPIRGIVHVAVMDRHGATDRDTLVRCVVSAVEEARKQRLTSLAIAAFGTGPRGPQLKLIDLEEWLVLAGEAIARQFAGWPVEEGREPLSVLIVLYETPEFTAQVRRLRGAFGGPAALLSRVPSSELVVA